MALVEHDEGPSALMKQATDVAGVCRQIVMNTAMDLKGKRYVRVEGWMSIAAAYGCVPSIREVVEEERGIRAVAELRKHDGTVLASAEGFCGLDEPTWATRALYARRGMAQTRAVSRVCRSVFAFVVTLIDAGLQTTPAEEIPFEGEQEPAVLVSPIEKVVSVMSGRPPPVRSKATQCKYGRVKGKFLCDIDEENLVWQLAAAKKSVDANDPKWGDANRRWLETIEAEVARRRTT